MKKQLGIIIGIILLWQGSALANITSFQDIESHWAKESIQRLVTNEVIKGYPDGTFRPNQEVTMVEFLKILMKTLQTPLVEGETISWQETYLATAKQYGIECEATQKVSRYDAAEILCKILALKSSKTTQKNWKDVSRDHQKSVSIVVQNKIMQGYEDKTFRGENNLTRAEAVTIATRALAKQEEQIASQQYAIESRYTNLKEDNNEKNEIKQIRYEIKNHQLLFYDTGRFSKVQGYTIQEKYVTNQQLIKMIESLVGEKSYTAVYYAPSPYIINQIIVKYGENEQIVNRNLEYFSFTFFEDKLFDAKRMLAKETFSNECFMKITLKKLWKENYEFEQNQVVNEAIQKKLLSCLQVTLGKSAEKVLDYFITKYQEEMTSKENLAEKFVIGNYIINTYQSDATSLEFYFEKLSS